MLKNHELETNMKNIKLVGIAAVVAIVAILSAPLWGGCNVAFQVCKLSCDVKHFDSKLKKAACKTSCGADKLSCLSR